MHSTRFIDLKYFNIDVLIKTLLAISFLALVRTTCIINVPLWVDFDCGCIIKWFYVEFLFTNSVAMLCYNVYGVTLCMYVWLSQYSTMLCFSVSHGGWQRLLAWYFRANWTRWRQDFVYNAGNRKKRHDLHGRRIATASYSRWIRVLPYRFAFASRLLIQDIA